MKFLVLISILGFNFPDALASPQEPDYLIIGKDTFSIYFLPVNKLDSARRNILLKNLQINDHSPVAVNLWRGFQAYWQLKDGKLFLVGLKGFKHSDSILQVSFPHDYHEGKVFAEWFSSYLAISKGKMLKWDGLFSRTYFKEEIFDFRNGLLVNSRIVDNYIDLKHGISRLKAKVITDTIYDRIRTLNWKKLQDCECDGQYWITLDEKGKIGTIEFGSLLESKKEEEEDSVDHISCIRKFKKKLKGLQFDIIRWNGKPYREKILFEVSYTDGKLENLTENTGGD